MSIATRHAFLAGQYKKVAGLLPDISKLCSRFPGDINLGIRADVFHLGALLHAKILRQAQARTPLEALTLAKESLSIRRYLYGPTCQSVAASYGNIAIFQIACGKYEAALVSLNQCMAIRKAQAKKVTANIIYTYLYYGWCYAMMDQHVAANEALAQTLAIMTKRYGKKRAEKKPLYVWIHTAQAFVYRKMGLKKLAKDADRRAFGASMSIHGLRSSRTLLPWYKSAWWHWENGSLQSARVTTLELVRTMRKENIYEGHQARALRLLSRIQEDMGLVAESKATMASALYLCDLVQDEQWSRKLRVFQTLDGSLSSVQSEMDKMFDELVFFYDR